MAKKSRLRIQKGSGGRRVTTILILGVLLFTIGYQLEQRFDIAKLCRDYYALIKKTFSHEKFIRGTIYDRNLKQLAVTMERVSVYVRTREIDSIEETAMLLSTVLQLDAKKLQDQLESGVLRLWVTEDINQEQEESIKDLSLSGVYLQRDSKRYYPNGPEVSHLIGYVEEGLGLAGVEYYYDRILASRKLLQKKEEKPQSNAQDLVLTIDLKIQSIIEDIVKEIALKENAYKVVAYLQESNRGKIIAGAHYPTFDPNKFTRYSKEIVQNFFLEPIYLPHEFRKFFRDAASLYSKQRRGEFSSAWSLVSPAEDLGSQLQLWSALGFDGDFAADFVPGSEMVDATLSTVSIASPYPDEYGTTPEILSPMQVLNACTILLGNGKIFKPNVVEKIIDIETDMEIDLSGVVDQFPAKYKEANYQLKALGPLFESEAVEIDSSALYLHDSVVLHENGASYVNGLTLVKIPAGSSDLFLLVLVKKYPEMVGSRVVEDYPIETVIDSRTERISVLQQVALSVADVVEPELGKEENYRSKLAKLPTLDSGKSTGSDEEMVISIMPDLVGLSLRKSLRLLRGIPINIKIEGTGQVIKQSPQPGTSLKGVAGCTLILASKEKDMYEELESEKAD